MEALPDRTASWTPLGATPIKAFFSALVVSLWPGSSRLTSDSYSPAFNDFPPTLDSPRPAATLALVVLCRRNLSILSEYPTIRSENRALGVRSNRGTDLAWVVQEGLCVPGMENTNHRLPEAGYEGGSRSGR